jgi:hypothetical protein
MARPKSKPVKAKKGIKQKPLKKPLSSSQQLKKVKAQAKTLKSSPKIKPLKIKKEKKENKGMKGMKKIKIANKKKLPQKPKVLALQKKRKSAEIRQTLMKSEKAKNLNKVPKIETIKKNPKMKAVIKPKARDKIKAQTSKPVKKVKIAKKHFKPKAISKTMIQKPVAAKSQKAPHQKSGSVMIPPMPAESMTFSSLPENETLKNSLETVVSEATEVPQEEKRHDESK